MWEYRFITAGDATELSVKVNVAVREGWELLGAQSSVASSVEG